MNTREELKKVYSSIIGALRLADKKYNNKTDDYTWTEIYENFTLNFIKDAGCRADVFISYNTEEDRATYLDNFMCLDDFEKYCKIL